MAGPTSKRIAVSRRLSQGGPDEIHELHSDQQPDTGIEPAPVKGDDLASVEGFYAEAHDHRQACARTGLAASQRSALVVQEIYRRGGGLTFLAWIVLSDADRDFAVPSRG